jgi:uncharacterized membrane protein
LLVALVGILAGLAAAHILYSAFCAFTWSKFVLFDYGVYTNMIWNSGHGRLFRMLVDDSYLRTHLSFTLALLGPLFRIWNHPFLLALLQWLFFIGGIAILWRLLARFRAPAELTAALILLAALHPFQQRVLLSEFHGVALYLFLIPWLYYCLRSRKRLVFLPLLLCLGLREDAGIVVIPMLLYFAVRDRWREGYFWAALALVYTLFALTTLFPSLTDMTLQARRGGLTGVRLQRILRGEVLWARAEAVFWVCLPALIFLRRGGWRPILVFPSAALLVSVCSPSLQQGVLGGHYSASVMAGLLAGVTEAIVQRRTGGPSANPWWNLLAAAGLMAAVLLAHARHGFIPGGANRYDVYRRIDPRGMAALRAARHIPRAGILQVEPALSAFVANRADLQSDWRFTNRADLIFFPLAGLNGRHRGVYRAFLADPRFQRLYEDDAFVVLGVRESRAE